MFVQKELFFPRRERGETENAGESLEKDEAGASSFSFSFPLDFLLHQ